MRQPTRSLRIVRIVALTLAMVWLALAPAAAVAVEPVGAATALLPVGGAVPSPQIDIDLYIDDRSDPVAVLRSYVNALNRHEYARAYGYWEPEAAAAQLPPFEQFARGFADTQAVHLQTAGDVRGDAGAGQLYYAVPVVLVAEKASGVTQMFFGCYQLHLAQPAIQAQPPYRPLAIRLAVLREVADNVRLAAPTGDLCAPM